MKKRQALEVSTKPGWELETKSAARCKSCGEWIGIGDKLYWRKIGGGKTEIRCRECCDAN